MLKSKESLYLIANWKLNKGKKETLEFLEKIPANFNKDQKVICAIAPVFTALDSAFLHLPLGLSLCAQDVFYEFQGSFTGECSSEHLKEVGVSYCIVGHSERRILFHENSEDVAKKAKSCFKSFITPIVCVGETLEERKNGLLFEVLQKQLEPVLKYTETYKEKGMVVAYEPVWAIGTNICAKKDEIDDAHGLISQIILKGQSDSLNKIKILYGGSVNLENISELVLLPNVDGVLVGGASLQVSSFLAMVKMLEKLIG